MRYTALPTMHELSLALSIVDVAASAAAERGAARILAVRVKVGRLSAVEPDALRAAFPIAADGTPCAGAELIVEEVAAHGRCPSCGAEGVVVDPLAPCAGCGHWPLELEGGRELTIDSLEVD